ncbi:electron transfer flavoprotein subunit beta/FixA family protein [Victivallis sp. Marseille-Q1083]|uniref:electron transfer flavoprotein subunit beta/FixA family protein n=1 Tax=Victivallis sp. Marseille-Q1083 TaxID=2717288 RepID=UPI00158BE77F|nr:electron transfer flavoprotein subunit beta/FixA family protein [Victivallis sp. Marseille-Q1083]
MRIIVPIKQVPETKAVKLDETTGTVIRQGVETIVNPLDLYAVEAALTLKSRCGGSITAVTMGPPQAAKALKEVLSMGVDDAVLISDRAFAGSDTWATGTILARAIRTLGHFDLILCGERATDGDTGQVGPELAAALGLPAATYVSAIGRLADNQAVVTRLLERGREELLLDLPALLTVVKEIGEPRLPTLNGKLRAKAAAIPVLNQQQLQLPEEYIGLKGSPTRVVKIFRPPLTRRCTLLRAGDSKQLNRHVAALRQFLQTRELI